MKRVLITGGAGFLGAWIQKHLQPYGIKARIFDLSDDPRQIAMIAPESLDGIEWVSGDITDTKVVSDAADGCDGVIHLAGLMTPSCQANPILGAQVNVIGTLNVFEAAKTHGMANVVYTSSGGVYGLEDNQPPLPSTHYGAFKLANESSARAYFDDNGISSFGFRPFVIYGPGRDKGLTAGISLACEAAAKGQPYSIKLTGPMSLVYVEDVAIAYVQALLQNTPGATVANLTGQRAAVEEAIDQITKNVPDARIFCAGPQIPSTATAPNDWATCGLELPVESTLSQGIAKTIQFSQQPTNTSTSTVPEI